jgi:hypothetical protein
VEATNKLRSPSYPIRKTGTDRISRTGVDVFQAGKYETGELAGWSQGDWNADRVFDSGDFVAAFQDGGYEMGPKAAVAAVPEPTTSAMIIPLVIGLLGVARRRA